MYCRQCGKPVNGDEELCEDCKVKFENTTTHEEPKSEIVTKCFVQTVELE